MKKKIVWLIIPIIIICLIGIFLFWKLTTSIQEEEKMRKEGIEEIQEKYDQLNILAENFNTKRQEYNQLFQDLYLNTLKEKGELFSEKLKEYNDSLNELKKLASMIDEKCQRDYQDTTTSKNCNSSKKTMESAIEVLKQDVKKYNDLIENYNQWIKENNLEETELIKYEILSEE